MRSLPYSTLAALIMLLGSVLPLSAALVGQFGFGLPPCHFCLLQRVPYIVVAMCALLVLLLKPQGVTLRLLIGVAIVSWLTTAGLGLYHTGIEQGWIDYSGGCVADTMATSMEELRMVIMNAPKVSCADAAATFLGLSMASWNAITALIWIGLLGEVSRRSRKVAA